MTGEVFPMEGGESLAPEKIDELLEGGVPNQDPIPYEPPSEEKTIQDDAPIQEEEAEEPLAAKDQVDPIVAQLSEALNKLTPEQRAKLIQPTPIEITHRGEKLQVPPDKQVALLQMGYNYSQNMQALNQERQQFEASKNEVTEKERYYGEIDRVAKENPEWWAHVQQSFQNFTGGAGNALNGTQGSPEMTPALRAALSKVTELEQKLDGFVSTQTKQAEMKQAQAEDAQLEQQIQEFSKQHADYDWLTVDESGLVLADRIIVHAHKNGINNFRAAARDYLHEDMLSRTQLKAKEELKKKIQVGHKTGATIKAKPTGLKAPKDLSKSYDDLFEEGVSELG